jgi:hypothetical protein
MISPGFAVVSRLFVQTGKFGLLAGILAASVEFSHLF